MLDLAIIEGLSREDRPANSFSDNFALFVQSRRQSAQDSAVDRRRPEVRIRPAQLEEKVDADTDSNGQKWANYGNLFLAICAEFRRQTSLDELDDC